jgi:hypothetical protein
VQVRTLLLASGSDLETVDSLSVEDYHNLYISMQMGLWGPYKSYLIAHTISQRLDMIHDRQGQVVMGKKWKPVQPAKFHELFPEIDKAASLGKGENRRKEKRFQKSLQSFITPDAPDWLKQSLKS